MFGTKPTSPVICSKQIRNNMYAHLFHKTALCLAILIVSQYSVLGQSRVSSTEQLRTVLMEDRDQGVILLDGDIYEVDDLEVKAGGVIKPAFGRKPKIVGRSFIANRNEEIDAGSGYWKMRVPDFKSGDYYVFDKEMKALPISGFHIMNDDGTPLIDSTIVVVDKGQMIIKIPLPSKYGFMKNKSKEELKNCVVKFGCWFRGVDLKNVYTDAQYLYGQSSNTYEFGLLHRYNYLPVTVNVFNYPGAELSSENVVFIDGENYLYVPNAITSVRVSTVSNLLCLMGNRELTIQNISFLGAHRAVLMNGASNKHIEKCSFSCLGKGIECYNGENNVFCGSSVVNCTFEHLYTAMAISFKGCDNVIIKNNRVDNVGIYTKGWYGAIAASGNGFLVENNTITDFCYCGISLGNSEHYGKEKIVGVVRNNVIDNIANYGHPETQAIDGGGIYVYANIDQLEISNNIVRNLGFENSWLRGIFLDGGAPNCTVTNNLVYNIYPSEYAMFAPYYNKSEHCTRNNSFEGNIVLGKWYVGCNPDNGNVRLKNNFTTTAPVIQQKDMVIEENNQEINAVVQPDGKVMVDRGTKVKKGSFGKNIRKMLNNRKRL